MLMGLSRYANQVLLVCFVVILCLPKMGGQAGQPFLAMYRVFMGGMIGAAWGRGVHASLTWQDYAAGGAVLLFLELATVVSQM
jgi:hypothetical protein